MGGRCSQKEVEIYVLKQAWKVARPKKLLVPINDEKGRCIGCLRCKKNFLKVCKPGVIVKETDKVCDCSPYICSVHLGLQSHLCQFFCNY